MPRSTYSTRRGGGLFKRVIWYRPRRAQPRPAELSDSVFWGLVLVCIGINLWPEARLVAYPFSILMTIAHEVMHLLAAIMMGGEAVGFVVTPDLGGVATSKREGDAAGAIAAGAGLLGPPLLAAIMIVLVRGLKQSALALIMLGVSLVVSGWIWGADLFTQACCYALGGLSVLLSFIGHPRLRSITAQIVAIFLSVSGVLALDYAFSIGGTVDGEVHFSDTFIVATYLGGHPYFWGALIAVTSVLILLLAYTISSPRGERRR